MLTRVPLQPSLFRGRVLVWFSCGAASACAGDKQVIGEDGTVWVCGICGGTGKRG